MAKQRYEILSGKLVGERQRWRSSAGDSVILSMLDDGDEVSAKGRESLGHLVNRNRYTLFGQWGGYKNRRSGINEKQFLFFAYCEEDETEDVAELMDLLIGRGFPRDLACRCVADDLTREMIERNPFRLLKYSGCGFKRCDDLWLSLKLPPARTKRQTICLTHQLSRPDDGSIWVTERDAQLNLRRAIPKGIKFDKATKLGLRAGLICRMRTDDEGRESWDGDEVWYADASKAKMESDVADVVVKQLVAEVRWPLISQGPLTDHQMAVVSRSLSRNIGILTGGGGTGKTFTTAHIVNEIANTTGSDILLVAPTGKAAVRMTEAMQGKFTARTIHSALGYRGDGWSNVNLAEEGYRFVIVDECSMVDLELMWRLLRAARECSVLLIGDPHQLPPVGPGAPFRDVIAAHPAVGELTETMRNSGEIVQAATKIRNGEEFAECLNVGNLLHVECPSPEVAIAAMLEEINSHAEEGIDCVEDVQVITQVKQRSDLSTKNLNQILQKHLNKNTPSGGMFAVGDKVMNLANSWLTPARDYPQSDECVMNDSGEIYVANGDMGRVVTIAAKYMIVCLKNPLRNVMAPTWATDADESDEDDTGSRFTLGYAITAHKCQGAEMPYSICMVDDYAGARRLLDRSMLYTIITRGKKRCLLLGPMRVMKNAIRKNSIWNRKTFLREKLTS